MVLSLVLVLIGAIFGIVMLVALLQNRPPSKMPVDMHGIITVLSFIILVAAAAGAVVVPTLAIVLLAIAAIGGLVLFIRDRQNKPLPRTLGIFNPIITILGALALFVFVVGGPRTAMMGSAMDANRSNANSPANPEQQPVAPGVGTGTSGMGDTTGSRSTTGTGTVGGMGGVGGLGSTNMDTTTARGRNLDTTQGNRTGTGLGTGNTGMGVPGSRDSTHWPRPVEPDTTGTPRIVSPDTTGAPRTLPDTLGR